MRACVRAGREEGERGREGGRREGGRERKRGREREKEREMQARFARALQNTQGGGARDDPTLEIIEQAQPASLTIYPC